jgi:hypothetical protein
MELAGSGTLVPFAVCSLGGVREARVFLRPRVSDSTTRIGQAARGTRKSKFGVAIASAAILATAAGSAVYGQDDATEPVFHTTAGPLTESEVGDILAHEHMLVEYAANPPIAYLDADPEKVYQVIGPWLEEARDLGISVFVDPTPPGVGQRPDIIQYVADRAGLPTMMVTGVYR